MTTRPDLFRRSKALEIPKPDDWFATDDRPVRERVDLSPLSLSDWEILDELEWGPFLRSDENWDAAIALLLVLFPNLEHINVGYHSEIRFRVPIILGWIRRVQTDPELAHIKSLRSIKSITHHASDSSLELQHLDPWFLVPSIRIFVADYINATPRTLPIKTPLGIQDLTLTQCAASEQDLQNLISSCPLLKRLHLQIGNFNLNPAVRFPLDGILQGLWEVREQLEEFTLLEAHSAWHENGRWKTRSLHHLTKMHRLEIQMNRFLERNIAWGPPEQFNFTNLPPALASLTLCVTNLETGYRIVDHLEDGLACLDAGAVKKLREVHVRLLHKGASREDRVWPFLARSYKKFAIVLSFDFEGSEWGEQERVVFPDEDVSDEDREDEVAADTDVPSWDTLAGSTEPDSSNGNSW